MTQCSISREGFQTSTSIKETSRLIERHREPEYRAVLAGHWRELSEQVPKVAHIVQVILTDAESAIARENNNIPSAREISKIQGRYSLHTYGDVTRMSIVWYTMNFYLYLIHIDFGHVFILGSDNPEYGSRELRSLANVIKAKISCEVIIDRVN